MTREEIASFERWVRAMMELEERMAREKARKREEQDRRLRDFLRSLPVEKR